MENPDQQEEETMNKKQRLISIAGCHTSTQIVLAMPASAQNNNIFKKTRDLPNLSECQACGLRIDVSTGKDKIQILYSEWRIVLLCKKCLSSVESRRFCSYCLKESTEDCFNCSQCKRSVHKDCFTSYKTAAPWSYSCSGTEFSICVDCWVPKAVLKTRGFVRSCKSSDNCVEIEKSNSRVLNGDGNSAEIDKSNSNCAQSLENIVREANCDADNMIAAATMARVKMERKTAAAIRALEKASEAIGLVAKSNEGGGGVKGKKVVDDDSRLAFLLHKVMNSSRRISRNLCLVNSSCLTLPKSLEGSDSGDPSAGFYVELCTDKELNESPDTSVLDSVVSARNENVGELLMEGAGCCANKLVKSSGGENSMNLESRSCHNNQSCGNPDRYLFKYRKRSSISDRYRFKYAKRNSNSDRYRFKYTKGNSNSDRYRFKYTKGNSSPNLYRLKYKRRNSSPNLYLFKYKRRNSSSNAFLNEKPKIFCPRSPCQTQALAAELSLNCSGESRTFPDGSLQPNDFPLQASASASGLS